jgi:hypothetical protein
MSPQDRIAKGARELLEQQYLESVDDQSKNGYARLSDTEKRATLRAFLEKRNSESDTQQLIILLLASL